MVSILYSFPQTFDPRLKAVQNFRRGRFKSESSVSGSFDGDHASPDARHASPSPSSFSNNSTTANMKQSFGQVQESLDLPTRPRFLPQFRSFTSSSTFGARASTSPAPSRSAVTEDPLGLQIVQPVDEPAGDIVFVHGLGGSAWRTWSWNRDTALFWPDWLPEEEPSLARFRISTFGYNASFRGAATNLTILDFAKDLLMQLLAAIEDDRDSHRPIIFVVHSMGGLVVKKAYTLGRHDDRYADLVARVRGILFLATPHRGSQYAKTLNNILAATPTGTTKAYVSGLDINSETIQDINEGFRQHCEGLLLCSFFETLKTSLGLTKAMIVEKSSAVLGFPLETSAGMDADHHTICKFRDRSDPNFRKVKSILKTWASELTDTGPPSMEADFQIEPELPSQENIDQRIRDIFGIRDLPQNTITPIDSDNISYSTSGGWLFEKEDFKSWLSYDSGQAADCRQFLLVGLPGTGKTVLSRLSVKRLQSMGLDVQHHFFERTNQFTSTKHYCLRAIAAQMALSIPEFRDAVLRLEAKTGHSLSSPAATLDFQALWERYFQGVLFKLKLSRPVYWVLDSLDESDSPGILLSLISSISSQTPIRVLMTSRPLKVAPTWDQARGTTYFLVASDTEADMGNYITRAVQDVVPGDPPTQAFVRDEILKKAHGSFLWARLALDLIQDSWHIKTDLLVALTEVPRGMAAMYKHMLKNVKTQNPRNGRLARRVLEWVTCSVRTLFVDEMAAALRPEFGEFLNLAVSMTQICGHFITIEQAQTQPGRQRISLIHTTAREFLLNEMGEDGIGSGWIDEQLAHETIAKTCLAYLCDEQWKSRFASIPVTTGDDLVGISGDFPLLRYAVNHWAKHVSKSPVDSVELLEAVEGFMLNHCLSWIEALSLSGNMTQLVQSAKHLKKFVKRSTRQPKSEPRQLVRSMGTESRVSLAWIQPWAVDFIRIASKFAANLVSSPSAVYRNVPPMCPRASMVAKVYGGQCAGGANFSSLPTARLDQGRLSVSGIRSETWDDCLASVLVGNDEFGNQVLAAEGLFFTLVSSAGVVTAWNVQTCEKVRRFKHTEYVPMMAIGRGGQTLAVGGYSCFVIWDVATGEKLHQIPKAVDAVVRHLRFGPGETELVAAFDNCAVQIIQVDDGASKTSKMSLAGLDSSYWGCPWRQAISADLTKVAMAWRGRPPVVWDPSNLARAPLRCRTRAMQDPLLYQEQLLWHPDNNRLLILCQDTSLWEWWLPSDDLVEYPNVKAKDIALSEDGSLLLTVEYTGTISIWTLPQLHLVYRLTCSLGGDPSIGVVFSPDSQRFYDIRGSVCNVWGPDALVRSDEDPDNDDATSTSGSYAVTEPVVTATPSAESTTITALAIGPEDKFFACAREDGSVVIHDALDDGNWLRKVHSHPLHSTVDLLSWSPSGKYMVSGDDSGYIVCKRLQIKDVKPPTPEKERTRNEPRGFIGRWAVFPVFDSRLREPARQVLFSPDEKLLVVSTDDAEHIWDLRAKQEVIRPLERKEGQTRGHWALHPTNPDRLLCLHGKVVREHKWSTGLEVTALTDQGQGGGPHGEHPQSSHVPDALPEPQAPSMPNSGHVSQSKTQTQSEAVVWSASIDSGRLRVAALSTNDNPWALTSHAGLDLYLLDTSCRPEPDNPKRLPAFVGEKVKLLLGSNGNNLVFLAFDGWVLSYNATNPMATGMESSCNSSETNASPTANNSQLGLRKHFFLPKDWLNTTTAHMSMVGTASDATFFCPKQGDVAIVRNGLRL
ncbi:hypothetical protein PoMZ_00119 [Pyricularia oryzae]|uniref:GPI inositol-deacylase n=1 Tax=Pyricularia oryzae TaxID=318829 RepID=A0A4P7N5E7_PYROR|nr:hypothetical protein PoMZ_00119 [Pyricularia oryzae]